VPKIFSNNVKSVLFADDTSLIVSNRNYVEYKEDINTAFLQLNEWFIANLLILNYKKAHCLEFRAQIYLFNEITVSYNNNNNNNDNTVLNVSNTQFLGITIQLSLPWKEHIFQLMPELSKACNIMRVIKPIMCIEPFKSVCCYSFYLQNYILV